VCRASRREFLIRGSIFHFCSTALRNAEATGPPHSLMLTTQVPNDISTSPAPQQPVSSSVSLLSVPRDVLRWQLMQHLSDADILLCGLTCIARVCCKFTLWKGENGAAIKLCCEALLRGQLDLMHWAMAFQMPLGDLCAVAARAGSLDVLKFAKERGALCDGRVAALAAKWCDIMMLLWLHNNGGVVDAQASVLPQSTTSRQRSRLCGPGGSDDSSTCTAASNTSSLVTESNGTSSLVTSGSSTCCWYH
jgi:hypothetical protein